MMGLSSSDTKPQLQLLVERSWAESAAFQPSADDCPTHPNQAQFTGFVFGSGPAAARARQL